MFRMSSLDVVEVLRDVCTLILHFKCDDDPNAQPQEKPSTTLVLLSSCVDSFNGLRS